MLLLSNLLQYIKLYGTLLLSIGNHGFVDNKLKYMKKIVTSIAFVCMFSVSSEAQSISDLKSAVKEAAKGFVWMVKVEVCKVAMLLFSSKGYVCQHPEHKDIYKGEK